MEQKGWTTKDVRQPTEIELLRIDVERVEFDIMFEGRNIRKRIAGLQDFCCKCFIVVLFTQIAALALVVVHMIK